MEPSSRIGCARWNSVFQVYAGPNASSAAKLVTSFMTEAGLRGISALNATRGSDSPIRCTQTLTEDSGTFIARATCATGAGSGVEAPAGYQSAVAISSASKAPP